jgi:hypothetical protein
MELLDFQPVKTYTRPHRLALWNVGPYRTIVEAHTDQQRDDAVASMGVDPQTDEEWALVLASFYRRTDINWAGAEPFMRCRQFFAFDAESRYWADVTLMPVPYEFLGAGIPRTGRRVKGKAVACVWIDTSEEWVISHMIDMWEMLPYAGSLIALHEREYKIRQEGKVAVPEPKDPSRKSVAIAAVACAKTILHRASHPRYKGDRRHSEWILEEISANKSAFADYVDLLRKEA